MKKELLIWVNQTKLSDQEEQMNLDQLSMLARSGKILGKLFKYHSVILHCDSLETLGQPFLVGMACRLLTFGTCKFVDDEGKVLNITIFELIGLFGTFLREQFTSYGYMKEIGKKIDMLSVGNTGKCIMEGSPLFLRCDLPYYYIAGGSIGHIAGVVNNLGKCTAYHPIFLSTRKIPTVDSSIKFYEIDHQVRFRNAGDIMSIAFNENIREALKQVFEKEKISFIYQRSALNAFAGIECSINKKVPIVLEYNGSEIWVAKNWGNRDIKGIGISERIERLTFEKADLITCVSAPLKEQLIDMGIEADKIIVTPNGVNPDMYHPDIDGTYIREKYDIAKDNIVIGFIGTFGVWHGAEILASAYAELVKEFENIHLLMIGDGAKMSEVREIIQSNHLEARATLTGIVPQKEGPLYLAACDILVSPTLRNPDGTPFFGSPTKLFEYMAMGKGIVASDIDQMSEVLEDEKTALLVEPNSVSAVREAIAKLIMDKELRLSLGKNAREEVCNKYTWKIHTEKIISALRRRMEVENIKNG